MAAQDMLSLGGGPPWRFICGASWFCLVDIGLSRVAAWGRCGSAMQSHAGVSRPWFSCRPSLRVGDSRLHRSNPALVTKHGGACWHHVCSSLGKHAFGVACCRAASCALAIAVRVVSTIPLSATLSVWPGWHASNSVVMVWHGRRAIRHISQRAPRDLLQRSHRVGRTT